jgi:predicted nucleic acid-binding protein
MKVLVDTSFVVALEDKNDQNRQRCLPIYTQAQFILMPQSMLNEVCYLLTKVGGNRTTASFLKRLPDMKYKFIALEPEDVSRTAGLLDQYASARVDFVDATLTAVAERLSITRILTLDQRDFHIIRPKHTPHFELLP